MDEESSLQVFCFYRWNHLITHRRSELKLASHLFTLEIFLVEFERPAIEPLTPSLGPSFLNTATATKQNLQNITTGGSSSH
jgi:hypothetical protein